MQRIDTRNAVPRRWAAAALALMTAVTLFAATRQASAANQDITDGSLDWGVKTSFVNYINGSIADGSVTPGDGATVSATGFLFGPASGSYDAATGAMNAAFGSGSLEFLGHDYGNGALIDLTISDLRIVLSNGSAVLIGDISSRELLRLDPSAQPGPMIEYNDIEIATLNFAGKVPTISGATITFTGVPATLTAEGAPAFASFYEAGAELDPVTFSVTLAAPATPTATATTVVPTATPTTPAATATATATPTTPTATATATTPAATATSVPPTATATPSPIVTQPVPNPQIQISKAVVNPAGDTITVTGTGFLPSLATGARPPLSGKPAGVYIAFASFPANWKPSAGAPSANRPTMPQTSGGLIWAVSEADRAIIGQEGSATLNPDGSFTATIKVLKDYPGADAGGAYGIFTYAGAGTTQPLYETFTPVTFSQAPATPTRATPGAPSTGTGTSDSPMSTGLWLALGGALLAAGAATFTVASKRTRTNR